MRTFFLVSILLIAGAGLAVPQVAAQAVPWEAHASGPQGSLGPALDPDPAFGSGGTALFFLDYPDALIGNGLRVYSLGGAGWYVLARHKAESGYWDAVVIRVRPNGTQDGIWLIPTPLKDIADAVMDEATGKFYFAGSGKSPLLPGSDRDFAVTCVDIQSVPGGGTCAGFGSVGSAGTAFVGFDLGGGGNDYARRVVVRPNIGLILIGVAEFNDIRDAPVMASLYRATGALYAGFGTGGRQVIGWHLPTDQVRIHVNDAALTNDPDAQTRLYFAGDLWVNDPLDKTGYVIVVNAMTGAPIAVRYADLSFGNCSTDCSDAVTAIRVLANGKLAVGGWTTDAALNRQLILGRLNVDGSWDAGFNDGGLFAAYMGLESTLGQAVPTALAERPGTGELVVAMDHRLDGAAATPTRQALGWFTANGREMLAWHDFGFSAAPGETPRTTGASLLVDPQSIMLVGTRRWNATDDDVTLTRLLFRDGESVFADSFETPAPVLRATAEDARFPLE